MAKPDMLLLHDGAPILVVEVKGREVPASFRNSVLLQLKEWVERSQARWALLVDPVELVLFRAGDYERPMATIPTAMVLGSRPLSGWSPHGERGLALALETWLVAVARSEVPPGPQLSGAADFLADLRRIDELRRDVAVG